jgi:transcriptional regulator with GAF, ATPase, and Fis domain
MSGGPEEHDEFLEHFLPGDAAAMRRLRDTVALLNRRYKNPPHMGRAVLLLGETGVGKNYVARVMAGHLYWLRDPDLWAPPGSRPGRSRTLLETTAEHFVEVPLPAIPDELIESELFGHVKGAFTGAGADKIGYFGEDEIRDLLLDEVGDASPKLQVKLLQVLNDHSFKRVGAPPNEVLTTQARILIATNRDLADLVRCGRFRADLYWRIQHLVVQIPPLREQRDLIPVLVDSIVTKILRENGESDTRLTVPARDVEWAKRQRWPGNIRELERLLWRWVYDEGARALEEVQRDYPEEDLSEQRAGGSLAEVVRRKIKAALDGGYSLASSVGEFAREIEREVQVSLYQIKNEMRLDHGVLGKLFGDGEKAAKQISEWKRAGGE